MTRQPQDASVMSRRMALQMGVATGASLLLGKAAVASSDPGVAAAPAATQPAASGDDASKTKADLQGAGFYRLSVGDLEVTVLSDGNLMLPSPQLFAVNAEPAALEASLKRSFLPTDKVVGQASPMLVRSDRELVLFDAGFGPGHGSSGRTLQSLRHAGVEPGDITTLVISHVHGDHVGGAVVDGKPVFPRARVLLCDKEHEFWSGPADLSKSKLPPEFAQSMRDQARQTFDALGKSITRIAAGDEVAAGVRSFAAFGHTPGHIGLLLESKGQVLRNIADVAHHHVLLLENPDWFAAFDTDAAVSVPTRRKVLDEAADRRELLLAYHFPFPNLGHVRKTGKGWEWVPMSWQW